MTGRGAPNEAPTCIKIYDCGLDKICYQAPGPDDNLIGQGGTNSSGVFTITLTRPLVAGEEIYALDTCEGVPPGQLGPIIIVVRPAPAPVMSPAMIVVLAASLSLVGLLGLSRLRLNK